MLDQKVAERHSAQAGLAVADGIEDRRGCSVRIVGNRPRAEQGTDGVGHPVHQRDLDENKRLVRKRRVEKGKAAAVALQPPVEIVPALNLVHRLMKNDLLQQVGRSVPIHADDLQKAGVEP